MLNQNTIKVNITLGSSKNNKFYSKVGVGAGQKEGPAPATLPIFMHFTNKLLSFIKEAYKKTW